MMRIVGDPEQVTIPAGTRFGPYEIGASLGAGGMGEVYRARDTRLDRAVAIKVLPSSLAQNAQFKLRFEREAKTISQLNHPHICTLHDIGAENGVSYLVMELVDGESLADVITRGPLTREDREAMLTGQRSPSELPEGSLRCRQRVRPRARHRALLPLPHHAALA